MWESLHSEWPIKNSSATPHWRKTIYLHCCWVNIFFLNSLSVLSHEKFHYYLLDYRCNSRFTHANRHCADHPFASLRRCHELALQPLTSQAVENSPDVLRWLENYKRRNEEKTPGKTCDANYDSDSNSLKKSSHSKAWKNQEQQENINERSNDKFKNRRNRGGIAKALQYGSSENCNESTVPLYRYYFVYFQFNYLEGLHKKF